MQGKKKFIALNNPAKEILFSLSGFGPNILMVLMGAYFLNAVDPSALGKHQSAAIWSISGTCLILPWLFSILWFVAKCFDGVIDLPLAGLTDNLKSKFGKRRTPIAICTIPMIVAYALCWYPISTNAIANSFWFFAWALTFFALYTMNLIAFYGSLSTTCADDKQRIRVASLKSVFDTISYALVYALVPLILDKTGIHIDKFVFMCLPLMLTIIIPLFLIKEGTRWEAKAIAQGYDISSIVEEKRVGFKESIKLSFKNKPFMKWVLVNCCSFFGLQLFLVSMNALIGDGGMGLSSTHMTILNTFAFAPVPVMLHLFNKVKERKGIRFAYQTALLSFAIAIMSFFFGNKIFMGNNTYAKLIVGSIGAIIGSYSIGSFFMMTYMVPTQMSSVEEKLTKKNHSAMYFATQAVFSSIAGAIATGLVWGTIKGLFFSTETIGIIRADSIEKAIEILRPIHNSSVFNLGNLIVPIIVSTFCVGGFCFAFLLPKKLNGEHLAKPLKLEKEYAAKKQLFVVNKYQFEPEPLWIDIGLWILSGSLFQYIWFVWLIDDNNTFAKKKMSKWHALGSLIPFYAAYLNYILNKTTVYKAKQLGIKVKNFSVLFIILSCLCLSVVCEIIIQNRLNKITKKQNVRKAVA